MNKKDALELAYDIMDLLVDMNIIPVHSVWSEEDDCGYFNEDAQELYDNIYELIEDYR